MVRNLIPIKGRIRGTTIQLDHRVDLPDGQEVNVQLTVVGEVGNGLRAAFGGWADESGELDAFLDSVRRDRNDDQREPAA